jgi:hypothetical protein
MSEDEGSPHAWIGAEGDPFYPVEQKLCHIGGAAYNAGKHSHGVWCAKCGTRRMACAEIGCYHYFIYLPAGRAPWFETEPACPPVSMETQDTALLCWEEEPPYGNRCCKLRKGHAEPHKFTYL